MPFDGVSFSSAGFKIFDPSDVNFQAEIHSKAEAETEIKKLNKAEKSQADTEKEDREGDLQGRDSEENEEQDDNQENFSNPAKNAISENKRFKVKFNQNADMIELVDTKTGTLIETLTPAQLLGLLSKTKIFSGIFVDKKI